MSAYKHTSPQKAAAQQTLEATIPMAQNPIPGFVAAAAAKMAEGALLVHDKAESNQEIVAAPQADDVAQELSQLAAALDAESVPTTPLALNQSGGPVLLAQAAQSNASDGGIDLLVDADGSLSTTGWAAVVGAGVLVAAAAGGGGGGGDVPPPPSVSATNLANVSGTYTVDLPNPPATYVLRNGVSEGSVQVAYKLDLDADGSNDDLRITYYPTGNSAQVLEFTNANGVTTLVVESLSVSLNWA